MRLRLLTAVPASLALLVGLTAPAPAFEAKALARAGTLLVTFADGTTAPARRAAHAAADASVEGRLGAISTEVVTVDDIPSALAEYRRRADVLDVEADGTVHALIAPSDEQYGLQWNLQPPSAANQGTLDWEPTYPTTQGQGVLVAVVDTGLRFGGPDGPENVRRDIDYDFVNDDLDAEDENGHGTHITGTIAQHTGNPVNNTGGVSVAGVASKASIVPIKVLDRFGEGTVSDTAAGILYAADHGAKVINLSLGGEFSRSLCDAVAVASRSALVVAASGNEAEGGFVPVSYPGGCPTAMGIGALRYNGTRAPYSNAGCDLAATGPGGDLSATGRLFPRTAGGEDPRNGILQEAYDPGRTAGNGFGYFYDSGTSMAAAHAAGAAAVLLAINPDLSTVRRAMLASARDLGAAGPDDEYGAGALDLARAVTMLQSGNVPSPKEALGYWMVATDGGIFAFGNAGFLGSTGDIRLNSPIVGMARTVTGRGYWMVAADGGIFTFGNATFLGSTGDMKLNSPIVGMATTPSGKGYWLVAEDGGIFTFGDAGFFGSTGAIRLNQPIVGMAPTGTGQGYWLVARDGGIFAFGDAKFLGSTGGTRLNSPIVSMAGDRTGQGYWLVASDGGIFTFGNAPFRGSTGNLKLNSPIVTLTPSPTSDGYWLVASDGGIFAFGDAGFFGSTGDIKLNRPIVGMASTCFGTGYWLVASDGGVFAFGNAPFLGSTGDIALNKPVVGMQLAIDHRSSQG
ncbi:MAG TPA: S8 family serine peptidase [Acidimicrobiales bacterium]|nr:S8 family serine peptidase [Acidimicrobiales bacterium]